MSLIDRVFALVEGHRIVAGGVEFQIELATGNLAILAVHHRKCVQSRLEI